MDLYVCFMGLVCIFYAICTSSSISIRSSGKAISFTPIQEPGREMVFIDLGAIVGMFQKGCKDIFLNHIIKGAVEVFQYFFQISIAISFAVQSRLSRSGFLQLHAYCTLNLNVF